jgi:hypothetical protein
MSEQKQEGVFHYKSDKIDEKILQEVLRIHDDITIIRADLVNAEMMAPVISKAVADGLKLAAGSPETWAAVADGIRARATASAGGWLFGGLATLFKRLAWIALILICAYIAGGHKAILALVKAATAE